VARGISADTLNHKTLKQAEVDYVDTYLSFSQYPLSGAGAAAKLTTAFEEFWGIL
jgi:rRNA pseudouridine-1189 N-methylase Emg1 (Nep1/Mra1 family)